MTEQNKIPQDKIDLAQKRFEELPENHKGMNNREYAEKYGIKLETDYKERFRERFQLDEAASRELPVTASRKEILAFIEEEIKTTRDTYYTKGFKDALRIVPSRIAAERQRIVELIEDMKARWHRAGSLNADYYQALDDLLSKIRGEECKCGDSRGKAAGSFKEICFCDCHYPKELYSKSGIQEEMKLCGLMTETVSRREFCPKVNCKEHPQNLT